MKLAIMQPYLFPYIGYFQLIRASDRFVFYDDVNYIKQGWINKNRIFINGVIFDFTVPLSKASSFRRICDTRIDEKSYSFWKDKLYKALEQGYRKARYFAEAMCVVDRVFASRVEFISELAALSVLETARYLSLETQFVVGSRHYANANYRGQARVIDICLREGASHYINPAGGVDLYQHANFNAYGIDLSFLRPDLQAYDQQCETFVPGLSVIDIMMHLTPARARNLVDHYELSK